MNGLISLSARGAPEAQPFATSLRDRLAALAQAHDYVRPHEADSHRLERDNQTVQGLVKALLAPYMQEGRERLFLEGDDVAIGVQSATALALVIHEQATNAMKYGALSTDGGIVGISCARSGGGYALLWIESGGPPVLAKPERRGFGTQLASRSVASHLAGSISHDWKPEGLTMRLEVSVERLLR